VKDKEIDEMLMAAHAPHSPGAETLGSVTESIKATLRPVRPLPPKWILTGGLILICTAVALAGAARAGFSGIERMNPWERVLVFSVLGILVVIGAKEFVNSMIPGSRHRFSAGAIVAIDSIALIGVFALSFRDYQVSHFITAGVACLLTGILHAIPAALLSWLFLRRGFAVNAVSAGLAAGTFAGLAGVSVLELHCTNFETAHLLVWHTAVIPLSAGTGALIAWGLGLLRQSK
jgi:hypothetical protein